MAIKKKSVSISPAVSITEPDAVARSKAKSARAQAADTARALATLVESKPETLLALNSFPSMPTASELKPVAGPVQDWVAGVFEANPDKEFTVNAVIDVLKKVDPGINENSIRFIVTELKRKSVIHHVRNEGHHQILKFSKPGELKPFPKRTLLVKPTTRTSVKASSAVIEGDLAVLREASVVIAKLEKLVSKNQEVLGQIARLKSVL
jgi:hypothetical protein